MQRETAILGAGCFWGVEWVFRQVPGILDVECGYAGGTVDAPTYEQVCSKTTRHAEVVRIEFDPERLGYDRLLEVFWAMHDPTQVDRQGPDIGDQYRSVIFTTTPAQAAVAEASRERAQERFPRPIATSIEPAPTFWPAEDYHQRYYAKTGHEPYCHVLPVATLRHLGLLPADA